MEIRKTPSVKTSPAKATKAQAKAKTKPTVSKPQVKTESAPLPKDTFTPTVHSSHDEPLSQMEKLREMSRNKGAKSGNSGGIEIEAKSDFNSGNGSGIEVEARTNTKKPGKVEVETEFTTKTGGPTEMEASAPKIRSIDEKAAWIADQKRRQMDAEFAQTKQPTIEMENPRQSPKIEVEAQTTSSVNPSAELAESPSASTSTNSPEVDTGTVKAKGAHAVSIVGLANSLYTTYDGAKKLGNGNYLEGGLQVTSGVLQTYASTDQVLETGRNLKLARAGEEIVEAGANGLKGAKFLGAVAGIGMATIDGVNAVKAFQKGDNAQGTSSAMSSAWGVASTFYPPAAAGALAHSLTRSFMEGKMANGKTRDQWVADKLDPMANIFENARARGIDKNRARGLELFREVAPKELLRMAANPKNRYAFANAIGGLLDKIGSTNDPFEKAKLQSELQQMRSIQREVRAYTEGQDSSGGLSSMGRRSYGL